MMDIKEERAERVNKKRQPHSAAVAYTVVAGRIVKPGGGVPPPIRTGSAYRTGYSTPIRRSWKN